MALLDHVQLFEIAAAQTPIFTVDWKIPSGLPGESSIAAEYAEPLFDTYGKIAFELTWSQYDILRPCHKLAKDYGWAVLTRTPNRIKKIFHKPIAAMILSSPTITDEAVTWEKIDYDSDECGTKLRCTESYVILYDAIATLVEEVVRRGGTAVIEPK